MKIVSLILSAYFVFGLFCLPMGDFSILPTLPAMYQQCQLEEDADMGPIDFITDHLINFDCLLDSHDGGDEQLPHQNSNYHPHPQSMVYFYQPAPAVSATLPSTEINLNIAESSDLPTGVINSVFRPPLDSIA